MAKALTTGTTLRVVREVHEDESGAALRFQQGAQGRLVLGDANYAAYLRLARRSQERQHPVGVTFGEGQTITEVIRADNDVPSQLLEEEPGQARVLFQGHDGVFRLRPEHPESARLRAELDEALRQKARVWFIAQKPDLALLDVLPAGRVTAAMTVDEMIDRIEFSVTCRQLGIAEIMASEFLNECSAHPLKESGYAILSVVVSYFEMIAQFINGEDSEKKSPKFFVQGFRAVYPATPLTDDDIKKVYRVVRCGMYHGGMTKMGTHLSRYFMNGFTLQGSDIFINPGRVIDEIKRHFIGYVARLRNLANTAERANFEKLCHQIGVDLPVHDSVTTSSTATRTSTTPAPWHPGGGRLH
jgi:hypothetical protein